MSFSIHDIDVAENEIYLMRIIDNQYIVKYYGDFMYMPNSYMEIKCILLEYCEVIY